MHHNILALAVKIEQIKNYYEIKFETLYILKIPPNVTVKQFKFKTVEKEIKDT